MKKSEIHEILNFMKVIYQGRKIDDSDDVIKTWEVMFDEFKKKDVLDSVKELARVSKYVPSIHEILDNINLSFKVEKLIRNDCIVMRVIYPDEIIPFRFSDKESAMQIINQLKLKPTKEDVRLLYENNVRSINTFTQTTHIDQSQRSEFDQRKKNEYYAVKLKNQY